jgi:hypothetical protein
MVVYGVVGLLVVLYAVVYSMVVLLEACELTAAITVAVWGLRLISKQFWKNVFGYKNR